ncbi:hypothetical protein DVS28_a2067 [Euzebya pacifica]|uniref:Uncharacterized protein n=1 Tax=Euzebya pacifica TaxID=1608957 RepID=A0A346XX05_9ACTN|nr:hypothetical protein [Euzebya pacifica]AXV06752.1 hypothetical protein DVS28_a2067 [Euzebya pacifica]
MTAADAMRRVDVHPRPDGSELADVTIDGRQTPRPVPLGGLGLFLSTLSDRGRQPVDVSIHELTGTVHTDVIWPRDQPPPPSAGPFEPHETVHLASILRSGPASPTGMPPLLKPPRRGGGRRLVLLGEQSGHTCPAPHARG